MSKGPNRVVVSLPCLRTETGPVSETLCFLVIWNSRRWANDQKPAILSVVHYRQNPSDSTLWCLIN
jgi:hypothetical protein